MSTDTHRLHTSADTSYFPYADAGVISFGMGINSLTGRGIGSKVVDHGGAKVLEGVDATTDGQTSYTHISVVTSVEDIFKSMSTTMSGGGSYGIFSGSAGFNRSEVEDFHSQATTILATCRVINSLEFIDDAKLKPEAVMLAKADPREFFGRFGDSYVQGILRGGYYIAMVSIFSQSRDVQKKLSASIEASFQGFGKGSGSFSQEVKAYSKFASLKITFLQQGGEGESDHANLGSNLEELSTKINKFTTTIKNHPVSMTILVSSLTSLLSFPAGSTNPNDIRKQRERLAEYAHDRNTMIALRNDLKHVRLHPELYEEAPSQDQLAKWDQKLVGNLNKLEQSSRSCQGDSDACPAVALDSLGEDFVIPKRLDSVVSIEESEKLGRVWKNQEGDWDGMWTRVGESRLFDAIWIKHGNGDTEKALLEIRVTGTAVQVLRTSSYGTASGQTIVRDGECHYSGTLNGREVSGTYACAWGTHTNWSATIIS